jgi:hypothetical protein
VDSTGYLSVAYSSDALAPVNIRGFGKFLGCASPYLMLCSAQTLVEVFEQLPVLQNNHHRSFQIFCDTNLVETSTYLIKLLPNVVTHIH